MMNCDAIRHATIAIEAVDTAGVRIAKAGSIAMLRAAIPVLKQLDAFDDIPQSHRQDFLVSIGTLNRYLQMSMGTQELVDALEKIRPCVAAAKAQCLETSAPSSLAPEAAANERVAVATPVQQQVPTAEQLDALIRASRELIAAIEEAPWIAANATEMGPTRIIDSVRVYWAIITLECVRNPRHLPFDKRRDSYAVAKWPNAMSLGDGLRRLYRVHDRILTSWGLQRICAIDGPIKIHGSGDGKKPAKLPDDYISVGPDWPPKIPPVDLQELRQSVEIISRARNDPAAGSPANQFICTIDDTIELLRFRPYEILIQTDPTYAGGLNINELNRLAKAAGVGSGRPVFEQEQVMHPDTAVVDERFLLCNHPDPKRQPLRIRTWRGLEMPTPQDAERAALVLIDRLGEWKPSFGPTLPSPSGLRLDPTPQRPGLFQSIANVWDTAATFFDSTTKIIVGITAVVGICVSLGTCVSRYHMAPATQSASRPTAP